MNRYQEPQTKGAALVIVMCLVGLLLLVAFSAWAYFKETETVMVEIEVEIVSEEGAAKAHMIRELTGIEFPPEIAKWANISFSGTSVSIDTEKLNVWLGKNWVSK